jgi:hypothetical protein
MTKYKTASNDVIKTVVYEYFSIQYTFYTYLRIYEMW